MSQSGSKVTLDWHRRIAALAGEIEEAEGPPAPGCYPTRLAMLIDLTLVEASRTLQDADRRVAIPDPSPAPPIDDEEF